MTAAATSSSTHLGPMIVKGVKRLVCLYAALYTFNSQIGNFVLCQGVSMEPTIMDGDVVFAERISVRRNRLARGDIVCAKSPLDSKVSLCKRLTHLELDTFNDGPSLMFSHRTRIPKGACWLQGDNVYRSNDSRHFGPVPLGLVTERVVLRVWPPSRISWL